VCFIYKSIRIEPSYYVGFLQEAVWRLHNGENNMHKYDAQTRYIFKTILS